MTALYAQGRSTQAQTLARSLTRRFPQHGPSWKILGSVLQRQGLLEEALVPMQWAAELLPQDVSAQGNLGVVLKALGRLEQAEASYRRAAQIEPTCAEIHNNHANVLKELGRLAQAEASYRLALELKPGYAEAHSNLGTVLQAQDRPVEAEASYRRALELKPQDAMVHANLGVLLKRSRPTDAEVCYRRALELKPDYAVGHANLGSLLQSQGRLTEAAVSFRQALELSPDDVVSHSGMLFGMAQNEALDAASLFAEHVRFGAQFEAPLRSQWQPHGNSREPDRCLQVGFVSGDLRNHAVASFIEPVLAHLGAHASLSLHAYANHVSEDKVSQRLRAYVKHWHRVASLSDAALAEKIRADGIDILIDLSGHTAHNRLLSFARKAAPVQISWMGYPGSTGLSAMDYYLSDRFLLPPGQFDAQFTEKLVYLPASAPFLPTADAPAVSELPALRNGYLTFGSFNRPSKISRRVIALWSQLLRAMPDARMLLGAMREDGQYDTLIDWFGEAGIERERLDFHARTNMQDYLALHQQVDVCLDSFPYSGGTTTLHALWMGVPTLTLAGETVAGRTGAGILGHVGLQALIARDEAAFVRQGLALVADLSELAKLRSGLRERFARSVPSQPELIAAGLERALRTMWQRWCAGLPAVSFEACVPKDANVKAGRLLEQRQIDTLGSLYSQGLFAEAEILARALTLNFPCHGFSWKILGAALQQQGRLEEALAPMQTAAALLPQDDQAHSNLGATLKSQHRLVEAEASHRRALELNPASAEAHNNLAVTLKSQGRLAEAEASYNRALALNPAYIQAHGNLGNVLKEQGRLSEAEASYRQALALAPSHAEAHNNLGLLLQQQGRLTEAELVYRRALELNPAYVDAYSNLSGLLSQEGLLAEAEAGLRQALALKPDADAAHSNLLFCLNQSEGLDAASLFAEHVRFGAQFEAPLRSQWQPHGNSREPDRCLQVGFVSGDLRNHAVASFIEPVLAHLGAHASLSLHAYANHVSEDKVSQRLRAYVKHWHRVASLSDAALAEKIRADGIDILIDLSGHTAHNRLLSFARKAAPVQISWMGYPGSTGLSAMDYYLSDRFLLPPGQFDAQFTEKLVYLPASAPFLPTADAPAVSELPAQRNGYLTFGSFNRPSKISRRVIALWSQLLRAMPDARMLLGAMREDGQYDTLIAWFGEAGIERERLDFHARTNMQDYLALHQQVDVCLDTFPYSGGTTTLHALWMGVPTLTLAGSTVAGRTGAGILGHVGLQALIAQDEAAFVRQGLALVADLSELAKLRSGLRERFARSVPSQPELIAAGLERALRTMWQRWCAGLPAVSFEACVPDSTASPQAHALALEQAQKELDQTLENSLQLAQKQHQSGQIEEAESLYRAILEARPRHPQANYQLGQLALQVKQPAAGLPYFAAALQAAPEQEPYWLSYIDALIQAGELETAAQVLALGRQHGLQGATVQALTAQLGEHAQSPAPMPVTASEQGPSAEEIDKLVALYQQRRLIEVETLARSLTLRFPTDGFGWKMLGVVLQEQGQLEAALASMQTAAALWPQDAETHGNLGNTFKHLGRLAEAEASYQRALALRPEHAVAQSNLGALLQEQGRLAEAEIRYRQALELKPRDAVAHGNLGTLLRSQGRLTEAEASLRQALALMPGDAQAHSNLLFCLNQSEGLDAASLFAEHVRFGAQFEAPLRSQWQPHGNSREPDRCLQVGFVSGDLRNHAVASFIEPVLAHLGAHASLSLHAYANHVSEDKVSQRLRAYVKHWHRVASLSDAALAEKIRADGIDILIDLSGHTAHNRLLSFARKAAPVQISWMGYPGSTGLSAMDYYLSDRFLLPPGQFDAQFTEKLVYLPASAPFLPTADAPAVSELPAQRNGYLTFGSFNRPSKISRRVIALWSQLLRAMPDARMLLGAMREDGQYDTLIAWFGEAGIERERLDFHARTNMQDYLALHQQVDVCLDTFPYSGGTTTLHALWMGVPTLTLAGSTVAGRTGAGILGHVGLQALIAQDEAAFVRQGLALVADLSELAKLRSGLRERFARSVPSQPELIAAGLERALRTMWQRWCAGLPATSFELNQASVQNLEITPRAIAETQT